MYTAVAIYYMNSTIRLIINSSFLRHDLHCINFHLFFLENPQMLCNDIDMNGNYQGAISITKSAKRCDRWEPYRTFKNISHNYCRNHGERNAWCYVNGHKEYCDVKPCQEECYENRGEEYYGRLSRSISGHKCLPWNSVTLRYSNVDHAYCRNFEGDLEGPWCYINKQNGRELCDVPKCAHPGKWPYILLLNVV